MLPEIVCQHSKRTCSTWFSRNVWKKNRRILLGWHDPVRYMWTLSMIKCKAAWKSCWKNEMGRAATVWSSTFYWYARITALANEIKVTILNRCWCVTSTYFVVLLADSPCVAIHLDAHASHLARKCESSGYCIAWRISLIRTIKLGLTFVKHSTLSYSYVFTYSEGKQPCTCTWWTDVEGNKHQHLCPFSIEGCKWCQTELTVAYWKRSNSTALFNSQALVGIYNIEHVVLEDSGRSTSRRGPSRDWHLKALHLPSWWRANVRKQTYKRLWWSCVPMLQHASWR